MLAINFSGLWEGSGGIINSLLSSHLCSSPLQNLMYKKGRITVLEKAEEPEIKLPTSVGSSKKQESSRKTSISVLLTMSKPLTVWTTTNSEKF